MYLGNWEKLEITDKEFLTLHYKKIGFFNINI